MTSQQPNTPQNDNSPWNQQVATILLRAIATGGLGGLGVLAASIISSDLPTLVLGGLLGFLGSGVASIATQFWNPLGNKLGQAAETGGQAIADGAESRLQRWKGRFTATERKYLEALQAHCYALECEGFSGLMPRLALNDIFVPLKLSGKDTRRIEGASQIWNFLPSESEPDLAVEERRLAIIARPGYGKTTLTRHLAYCFSSPKYQDEKVKYLMPILLRFRDIYSQIRSEKEPSLEALAVTMIQNLPMPSDQTIGVTEAWLRDDKLKAGTCLVMLDGLDEVPEGTRENPLRERVSKWAHYQMQRFPSLFVLTSRPHGYDGALFPTLRPLQILDFNNKQKRTFLDKWYPVERWQNKWDFLYRESIRKPEADQLSEQQAREQSQAEGLEAARNLYEQIIANSAINQQLAVNPLLLTIIAATHQAFDSLPDRRVTLYQKMFNLLLEDRPNRRDTSLAIRDAKGNQELLQNLAMKLSQQDHTQFRLADAEQWIGQAIQQVDTEQPYSTRQFLQQIEQIAGLLVGDDGNLYEFAHKTFQEYLVAVELSENSILPLQSRLQQPDWTLIESWKEVFSFYAALTRADFLVEAIANMPEGDTRRNTVLLLHHIVSNEKSKIKPEHRQQLDDWMAELSLENLADEQVAIITLEQRFQRMIDLEEGVSITAEPITWTEYQQFLEAQANGQFHSQAELREIPQNQLSLPVTGISTVDQNWFCAWLATQTPLQTGTTVYDYRLPTAKQIESAGLTAQNRFYIARVTLPPHYQSLVNLLANGAWKEADQETTRLMLQIRGKDSSDYLKIKDLEEFPCMDLSHIDQLWVKNSGELFGFSVQKKIWQECGSPMDYNKAWENFGDRVGWRAKREWLSYNSLNPSLSSPQGNFPIGRWFDGLALGGRRRFFSSLASRLVNCNL